MSKVCQMLSQIAGVQRSVRQWGDYQFCDVFYRCQIWHLNLVRLAPNATNLGLFKISFSTFWRTAPKCTETDLKKSQICPIWGQSDLILLPNMTSQDDTLVAFIDSSKTTQLNQYIIHFISIYDGICDHIII